MLSRPTPNETIVEQLFPKVVANHVSKLPEFEKVGYPDILNAVSNPEIALEDRLETVASFVGNKALTESLLTEATIMQFCATGREAEITDESRRATYAESDTNQQKDSVSSRTLDYYLRNGVEVIFDSEERTAARRFCELDDRNVPLIEKLKAKRLLTINGFEDSRVMYTVHDLIDHAWLFGQMRESGIMENYEGFLSSVEMGSDAFLYSRQAELLASVGFGSRRWAVAGAQGEKLILNEQHVTTILASYDTPQTARATSILQAMDTGQRQQAVFMIENMAIQFADERRRWGAVKQIDRAGNRKPMELLDPLHVALMIETLGLLQHTKNYRRVQLVATLGVENMLTDALNDHNVSGTLHIPVPRTLRSDEIPDTENARWISDNLSVSTSYNRIG